MVPGWDETLDGLQSSGEDRDRHWLVPGRRAGGQAEPPASQSCSPQHVWVRMPVPLCAEHLPLCSGSWRVTGLGRCPGARGHVPPSCPVLPDSPWLSHSVGSKRGHQDGWEVASPMVMS